MKLKMKRAERKANEMLLRKQPKHTMREKKMMTIMIMAVTVDLRSKSKKARDQC